MKIEIPKSVINMEQFADTFLLYTNVVQLVSDPDIPLLVGLLIEMIEPVPHLSLPGELSPPLLELRPHHLVHGRDLLVVTV